MNVYYSEANVPRAYNVMGEVVATADQLVSARKVQENMVKKAKQKGADAVVLLGMEHYLAGESTSYNESTTESKDKKGNSESMTSGFSSTNVQEKKKIRALFIKFKPGGETVEGAAAPVDKRH